MNVSNSSIFSGNSGITSMQSVYKNWFVGVYLFVIALINSYDAYPPKNADNG